MSDRKYRQRGYQDEPSARPKNPQGPRPAPEPGAPAGTRRISQDGPKNINMPVAAIRTKAPIVNGVAQFRGFLRSTMITRSDEMSDIGIMMFGPDRFARNDR